MVDFIRLLAFGRKPSNLDIFAFSGNLSAENSKLSAESCNCGHHLLGCMVILTEYFWSVLGVFFEKERPC